MSKFTKYMVEGIQKDVELKIMNFFKEKPNSQDSAVHAFAEKLKINNHVFEGLIYQILGQFFGAGRAHEKNFIEKDANGKELEIGIKVEYEHTNNYEISKRIALDHLAEIPDYYTRLLEMEEDAGMDVEDYK